MMPGRSKRRNVKGFVLVMAKLLAISAIAPLLHVDGAKGSGFQNLAAFWRRPCDESLLKSYISVFYVNGHQEASRQFTIGVGDSVTIKVTTRDGKGVQLACGGKKIAFSLSGGTSDGTISAVTDHGNGTYSATFTATTAGTVDNLSATINGNAISSGSPKIRVINGMNDAPYVTHLLAWYRADDDDLPASNPDGTSITNWDDESGNDWDGTQGGGSRYGPKYYKNVVNGKPVLRFINYGSTTGTTSSCTDLDNEGTYLSIHETAQNGIALNSSFTIFSVARLNKVGNSGSRNSYVFAFQDASYADVYRLRFVGDATCSAEAKFSGTWWGSSVTTTTATFPEMKTQFNIISNTANSSKVYKTWINGASDPIVDYTSSGSLGPSTATRGLIGAQYASASAKDGYLEGDLAELIIFKTEMSTEERREIEDYLAAKYNISRANFTPPACQPVSVSTSTISAAHVNGTDTTGTQLTLGAGDSVTLKVTARDATGEVVTCTSHTIAFSLSSGTSNGTIGPVTNNGDGTYTATYTATTAGTVDVLSATIDGDAIISGNPGIKVITGPNDSAYSSNLLAWYSADKISPAPSDGADVTTWDDQSANNWDATQSGAARYKPKFQSSVVNGKPVLRFFNYGSTTGTTASCTSVDEEGTYFTIDNLATSGIAANAEFTAFYVLKLDMVGNSGSTNQYPFAFQSSAFEDVFRNRFVGNTSCSGDAKLSVTWYGRDNTSSSTYPLVSAQFNVFTTTANSSKNIKLYMNGGSPKVDYTTTTGTLLPSNAAKGLIGAQYTETGVRDGFLTGDLAELIIYKTVLSDSQRQEIQDYLAAKYGITISH